MVASEYKLLTSMARDLWEQGGKANLAVMHPDRRLKLSDEFNRFRLPREDVTVSAINTEFGEIKVYATPWCPRDRVYLVDEAKAEQLIENMKLLRSLELDDAAS
jgi:hypothetical protein